MRVYGSTPQEVYEGYTPGYWGTEVEDGVVVYGTGHYYPPWVDADWGPAIFVEEAPHTATAAVAAARTRAGAVVVATPVAVAGRALGT